MTEFITAWMHTSIGKLRDERGMTQSAENALLVAGAVVVAGVVVALVTAYVKSKLAGLG